MQQRRARPESRKPPGGADAIGILACDLFLSLLEQVRQRCDFDVFGYVVMPEHINVLLGEPSIGNPSTVMQLLKQRMTNRVLKRRAKPQHCEQQSFWLGKPAQARHLWQPRFHDFNVFTQRKFIEKLRYIHRNPVKRGLVELLEQWRWSSYRHYAFGEEGPVRIGYTSKRWKSRNAS